MYYPYNEETKEFHHKSKYELWIANGKSHVGPRKPVNLRHDLITDEEREALWDAYIQWGRTVDLEKREAKDEMMEALS